MRNYRFLVVPALVAGFFAACKPTPENSPAPKPLFQQYFPLAQGSWRIYRVDSIGQPDTIKNNLDTSRYQLKEVVGDSYTDGAGNLMYKILRYYRETDHDTWVLREVLSAGVTDREAIQQEGNARYVKLIFPVQQGRSWNANLYNMEDPDGIYRSTYTAVHQPDMVDSLHFDSTATVLVRSDVTAIYSDSAVEKYAAGVGLIDSRHDSVSTQAASYWIRKRIVSFGR